MREDRISYTLFAQLAASGGVEAMTQVNGWYDAYFRAMFTLGWVQSDIHFEAYEFGSAVLSIALAKLAECLRG